MAAIPTGSLPRRSIPKTWDEAGTVGTSSLPGKFVRMRMVGGRGFSERKGDLFTLRYRDYPKYLPSVRHPLGRGLAEARLPHEEPALRSFHSRGLSGPFGFTEDGHDKEKATD